MVRKSRPSTIYIPGETVEQARRIEQLTGVKASKLFRQFVARYARSLRNGKTLSLSSVAFLLPGYVPWELYSPRPFFEREAPASVAGADIWLEAFSRNQSQARRVFLMGNTLANPISNHEDLWVKFMTAGGTLQVLLQGDLSGGAQPGQRLSANTDAAHNQDRVRVRQKTTEALKRISQAAPDTRVEVRNSGTTLLKTNASLIFREDYSLDIYVSFNFAEGSGGRPIVVLTTASYDPPDETCELVVGPLERLWLASVTEPGFEEPVGPAPAAQGNGRRKATSGS